jgi:hypothetical protein
MYVRLGVPKPVEKTMTGYEPARVGYSIVRSRWRFRCSSSSVAAGMTPTGISPACDV